ncbi:DUF2953 domain-containing protein [Paenibacillus eucommiae]|uniref:Thiamine transporter ThiT n=1 Tax=Paenibacillus eucommiae TaxID=1355755 RepID=A0ABS4IMZ8_9BACL|nr:DUF2953 domain-containing protein [Paenibacillus eucommiae]MBP1988941.1 thiamine transporter ThiT [Paenibacillus eucommiae]
MIWLWVVGIVLFAVIVILCFSYISGNIFFSREKDNDEIVVEIQALFGLLHYRYVVPMIKFKGFAEGIQVKSKLVNENTSAPLSETKERITQDKIIRFYHTAKILLQNAVHLYEWLKRSLSHVQCMKLTWSTHVGLEDAPETAITTGAVWAMKSSLLGFIMPYVQIKCRPLIEVVPEYNRMQFTTVFSCAVRVRFFYAMLAAVQLLYRILKVKGGLRTWYRIMMNRKVKLFS